MPMRDLDGHLRFQHQQAFETLLCTLRDLSKSPRNPEHLGARLARDRTEDIALSLIPGLEYGYDLLCLAVSASSLPLLKTLCQDPEWREGLEKRASHFSFNQNREDFVDIEKASAEFLIYLQDHGFQLHLARRGFGRRFLYEESPLLDAIASAAFPGFEDPVLGAMTHSTTALWSMTPGRGLRHLHTLRRLARTGNPDTIASLQKMAKAKLEILDWRSLSLLIWIGPDLSHLAPETPEPISNLLSLSGSQHGQLHLNTLEPDIEGLAGRDLDAPRFGITIDQFQAAMKRQRSRARSSSN